jgi:WD40 repeat protein
LFVVSIPVIGISQTKELKLRQGRSWITAVHFMPDGKSLISSSSNGTVVAWDAQLGKALWKFDLDAKSKTGNRYTISHIGDMSISPNGNTIAISYYKSIVFCEYIL